jgi:hypothetical protein
MIAAAQLDQPIAEAALDGGFIPTGHLHQVNRRDPLAAGEAPRLVFEVLVELPLADLALEVPRGYTNQQQLRVPQPGQDPVSPDLESQNLFGIEVHAQRRPRKFLILLFDAVHQLGDVSLPIVDARVADEQLVIHGDRTLIEQG